MTLDTTSFFRIDIVYSRRTEQKCDVWLTGRTRAQSAGRAATRHTQSSIVHRVLLTPTPWLRRAHSNSWGTQRASVAASKCTGRHTDTFYARVTKNSSIFKTTKINRNVSWHIKKKVKRRYVQQVSLVFPQIRLKLRF